MRSIVLSDAITGESLHIEFDLDRNQMRIDGSKVVREAALESGRDQLVYVPAGPWRSRLFRLTRSQVNEMRVLWGCKPIQ